MTDWMKDSGNWAFQVEIGWGDTDPSLHVMHSTSMFEAMRRMENALVNNARTVRVTPVRKQKWTSEFGESAHDEEDAATQAEVAADHQGSADGVQATAREGTEG